MDGDDHACQQFSEIDLTVPVLQNLIPFEKSKSRRCRKHVSRVGCACCSRMRWLTVPHFLGVIWKGAQSTT